MCGNLSWAAFRIGFNICMKMVVEIGLAAINTDKLNIETRPKRAAKDIAMEMEMEWKMVVYMNYMKMNILSGTLAWHSSVLLSCLLVYENMLNTTKWIF